MWYHTVLWGRNGKLNKPPNKPGCVLSEAPTSALSCGRGSPVSCALAACPGFVLTAQQACWHGLCQPGDAKQSCRRSVAAACCFLPKSPCWKKALAQLERAEPHPTSSAPACPAAMGCLVPSAWELGCLCHYRRAPGQPQPPGLFILLGRMLCNALPPLVGTLGPRLAFAFQGEAIRRPSAWDWGGLRLLEKRRRFPRWDFFGLCSGAFPSEAF